MASLNLKNKKLSEDEEQSGGSRYSDSQIRLTKNRNIFISEDFTKEMASTVIALLLYYDHKDPEKEINIILNSNGGDASSLLAIYDVMQMISAPIRTVCFSKCYSAAAILLSTGTKGKRFALKNSQIMIHGLQCSFPVIGDADQVGAENYYNFLEKSNSSVLSILAKHSGKSLEQVKKDCSRDLYLTADQALKYGLVDEVL